ncbi:hypothetical protein KEM48_005724 [Puccinia striiformis f. sp. tritici PST-130]|nr:hypothetical protein KEM48_005724 [Puccinia striiformis f. sp. tritici PST-130]
MGDAAVTESTSGVKLGVVETTSLRVDGRKNRLPIASRPSGPDRSYLVQSLPRCRCTHRRAPPWTPVCLPSSLRPRSSASEVQAQLVSLSGFSTVTASVLVVLLTTVTLTPRSIDKHLPPPCLTTSNTTKPSRLPGPVPRSPTLCNVPPYVRTDTLSSRVDHAKSLTCPPPRLVNTGTPRSTWSA